MEGKSGGQNREPGTVLASCLDQRRGEGGRWKCVWLCHSGVVKHVESLFYFFVRGGHVDGGLVGAE